MSKLRLWGRTTSGNVQKPMWLLAELGIDYERIDVGGEFGGNDTPEYLAMNPNGRVPTLEDGELVLIDAERLAGRVPSR